MDDWFSSYVEQTDDDLKNVATRLDAGARDDDAPEDSARFLTTITTEGGMAESDLKEIAAGMEHAGLDDLTELGADANEAEDRGLRAVECRFRKNADGLYQAEED